jgi:hypothetical protein
MTFIVVIFRGKVLTEDSKNTDRQIKDERNDTQRDRQTECLDRWKDGWMDRFDRFID